MYTVYGLANPAQSFAWEHIKYIGISTNIHYRFSQHIACNDSCQPEKNDWIRGILLQDLLPALYVLEKNINDKAAARAREQYWIRYAMSQGATLYNKAITYTDEERIQAHQERTILYTNINKLLHQGYFVKRSVYWYPSHLGPLYSTVDEPIKIWEFHSLYAQDEHGELFSVLDCSDAIFDTFVKQHLSVVDGGEIEWTFEDRVHAIRNMQARGIALNLFCAEEKPEKHKRKKR